MPDPVAAVTTGGALLTERKRRGIKTVNDKKPNDSSDIRVRPVSHRKYDGNGKRDIFTSECGMP